MKKWVLESIGCAWRLFKCRLKANHYYKYDNDSERWKHRPSRIPDSHFKLLLQYWNTSAAKVIFLYHFVYIFFVYFIRYFCLKYIILCDHVYLQKISAKNSKNRELLDNMHTAGPVSFARIYQKLVRK